MQIKIDRHKLIMGIGSNAVDVIYRVRRIAGKDEKTYILPNNEGNMVKEVAGGVVLNHLAWARLLGVRTGLFGFQGDDRFGKFIRGTMDVHGIERSYVKVKEGKSSTFAIINVDTHAERAIYMASALTGTTTSEDIKREFSECISNAGMVTTEISQLPLDAVVAVLSIAKESDVPTVLDVDVPPSFAVDLAGLGSRKEFEKALSLADLIKPAKAVADQIVGGDTSEDKARDIFQKYSPRLVAVTDGAEGSVLYDGGSIVRVKSNSVVARDTTGAGDAFLGGVIAGIYYGLSLEDIGKLANACGAACCTVAGAFPVMDSSLEYVGSLYDRGRVDALEGILIGQSEGANDCTSVGIETVRNQIDH